jgi:hypothetical protein
LYDCYAAIIPDAEHHARRDGGRPQNTEVDVGLIYADYYFLEALLRYARYSGNTAVNTLYVNYPKSGILNALPDWQFDLLGRKGSVISARAAAAPGVYIVRPAGNIKKKYSGW